MSRPLYLTLVITNHCFLSARVLELQFLFLTPSPAWDIESADCCRFSSPPLFPLPPPNSPDVQAVGHDCDLALLSVEDEAFWTGPTAMLPLELGPVPELQQGVVVVGYPTGGDNTSVTSGVVSRVEVAQYAHAASHLMACQIDAAINPGGWGEIGGG